RREHLVISQQNFHYRQPEQRNPYPVEQCLRSMLMRETYLVSCCMCHFFSKTTWVLRSRRELQPLLMRIQAPHGPECLLLTSRDNGRLPTAGYQLPLPSDLR